MAKNTVVTVTDDLDGSDDAQTHTFSLNGVEYSIDLGEKNAAKLEKALAPFLAAATKVSGRRKAAGSSASSKRSDLSEVRAWAKSNGYPVSERGRIAADIMEKYDSAN